MPQVATGGDSPPHPTQPDLPPPLPALPALQLAFRFAEAWAALVRRGAFEELTTRFDQHMMSIMCHPLAPADLCRAAAMPRALPTGMYSDQIYYTHEPILFSLQRWQAAGGASPTGIDRLSASGAAALCFFHLLSRVAICCSP